MSSQETITLRTIGAASTALAISSASLNASLTLFTIPRCLELPPPLNAQIWANMFRVTKWAVPIPMLISGAGYYYLAWTQRNIPSTIVVLPTINTLLEKLASWKDASVHQIQEDEDLGTTAHALIRRWSILNLGRAIPVMLAGLLGLYSYL
ncbi:hypothetical protein PFICI_11266 [Pestalotiopsis fici W106-1]|uniref:DUF1772-domain-containing protein n=1 Tax=Pestalotiopsis fici (strain W106-1 / CGMCC3.15140) TaxID=1229662 RepID=W3WWA0_PESFW|nr:uncharacterized protein PFICI_11266 [Pestalotiopsis fici W106-1]ETS77392.1 hypothetical protein PFICI_11266 [Pestalotiopsis fici W106-1]